MFSATVLAEMEKHLGGPIVNYFDLIAGTSTGGIIALALGAGISPQEIVEFYSRYSPSIFPGGRMRGVRHLIRAKYSSSGLRSAVTEVLGDRIMADSSNCR